VPALKGSPAGGRTSAASAARWTRVVARGPGLQNRCTTDELLGVTPTTATLSPKTARLLKRLQRIEEFPPAIQCAVLEVVDAMLDTRRRSTPPSRAKRKAS
jgi:hypothetical protein